MFSQVKHHQLKVILLLFFSPLFVFPQAKPEIEHRNEVLIGYLRDNTIQLFDGKTSSENLYYFNSLFLNYQFSSKFSAKLFVGAPLTVFKDRKFRGNNFVSLTGEYIFPLYKKKFSMGLGAEVGRCVQTRVGFTTIVLQHFGILNRFYFQVYKRTQLFFQPFTFSRFFRNTNYVDELDKDFNLNGYSFTKLLAFGVQFRLFGSVQRKVPENKQE